MTASHPQHRLTITAATLAALLLAAPSPAAASGQERFPDVRLTYGDLALNSATGRQALVERVEATASSHCARYGALILPPERRGQSRYCVYAVRGDILRALPRPVRAAYDLGRRAGRDGA